MNIRNGPSALAAALVCAALLATGCPGNGGTAAGKALVVSSLPMQGSAMGQTRSVVNGIRLAFEEVSYKAGDLEFAYEPWDDATAQTGTWDATQEAQNARRAAGDERILAYIGTFNSGAAKVAMPVLNRAGLLMVSPANTATGLTKPGLGESGEPGIYRPSGQVNYFRVVPADDIQGTAAAVWAADLGVKKVYILDDQEVYGRGIANVFERACKDRGIQVLGHDGIDRRAPEYKALMTRVAQTGPDLLYFGGITQNNAGQLVKDMRAVGLECRFMGPDGVFEQAFIEAAGAENLEGRTYTTFGGVPPDQLKEGRAAEFARTYREKFGIEPEAYAVYGYEAARVVAHCLREAGARDRSLVLEACRRLKDFDGVLGRWSFDANGDTDMTMMSGSTVVGGRFQFVRFLTVE
ncbi:MAG: branched-chain amino acid ABC transporter substrate-binding protein [Planctomycetes bacterium]|nr:branched-chain amino acid ABC transporter substrate-binding protein [Planctomycetota bacterium]